MVAALEVRSTIVTTLQSVYRKDMGTINDVPDLLEQCLEQDAWREFVTADGELVRYAADEFAVFLETKPVKGLGASREGIEAILTAAGPDRLKLLRRVQDLLTMEPLPANGEVGNGRESRFRITKPTADDATYALRRLKRDAPKLAAKVAAGLMSPHAAAVKAGIRRRYIQVRADDIDRALSKLIEFYTPDEIRGALKRAGR